MNKAIATGEGTKGKRIKLVNRGINGGGVLQITDKAPKGRIPRQQPASGVCEAHRL